MIKILALLLFLLGCSSSIESYSSVSSRAPGSVKDKSCRTIVGDLFNKRGRAKKVENLIKDGDLDSIKRLFANANEAERQVQKKPYGRFYRRLRRLNNSTQVPALFQTQNKFVGKVDTFSTIVRVVDQNRVVSDDESEAIDDILGWIEHVKLYKQRFNKEIEIGFESNRLLNEMTKQVSGPDRLARKDFPTTMRVPIVNKGEVTESTMRFEDFEDLKDFMKEKRREVKLSFARSYLDEYFKKSRLYDVLLDQALFIRRLELVLERLNSMPIDKLSENQLALKEMIHEVLETSEYQARQDVMNLVRQKEFRTEFWAALKFWRSKRVAREAKYTLPDSVIEQARKLSPYGVMLRSAAVLTVVSGAVISPLTIIYNDNPWVMYVTSMISNYYNDFLVYSLGLPSVPLSKCYKSQRAWSIEEASDMNNFVESHLSRFTAYQRIDPSYSPEEDSQYLKSKLELQALCSKKRLEYRAAARHVENKKLLNEHGYRFAAHMILVELVEMEMDDGPKVAQVLYDYFEQTELFEDHQKAKNSLRKLESLTNSNFVEDIKDYRRNIEGMVPRIKAGDFPIYYPTSKDFLDTINKR